MSTALCVSLLALLLISAASPMVICPECDCAEVDCPLDSHSVLPPPLPMGKCGCRCPICVPNTTCPPCNCPMIGMCRKGTHLVYPPPPPVGQCGCSCPHCVPDDCACFCPAVKCANGTHIVYPPPATQGPDGFCTCACPYCKPNTC
ncbi:hypothetical protein QR680_015185 [Steinernema hermaphroditum]|uniref:Antistasin-like domain-containing protein n=1 Tax=Steinernema hermaphroditum TaxID=289476 RepID=A0AA39M552_9BILA|nr:hypothetical protein QR680_015185 [Steinernema hermaphroditum]